MKRLSIIMATVMLFVSCLCITADAQGSVKVSVNTPDEVGKGTEFTVSVDFSENTGFNTLGVKLTYPEGFTYVEDSAEGSDLIKEEFYLNFAGYAGETFVFYHDATARTLTFVGASLYDIETASDTLFTAKFTAPDAESANNQFTVEIVDDVYNATGETVTITPENGSTDVVEKTYVLGDVNGDGYPNNVDALLILQSIVGGYTLTDEQKIVGDVNKDGFANNVDALLILQAMVNGTPLS